MESNKLKRLLMLGHSCRLIPAKEDLRKKQRTRKSDKTLTARVDQSGKQVQDIAVEAVEGVSILKTFTAEETNRHRKES